MVGNRGTTLSLGVIASGPSGDDLTRVPVHRAIRTVASLVRDTIT